MVCRLLRGTCPVRRNLSTLGPYQVGNERRVWADGKVLVFDTSVMHEAANTDPKQPRFVLMLRVWHPATTAAERRALQFIFDACADPALVASDAQLFLYPELTAARAAHYEALLASLA